MSREELIKSTIENLNQLSDTRIQEVSDYVRFLSSRIDDKIISEGINILTSNSKTYAFLHDEEELYQVNDLKEVYK
jgi:GTP:adenosylcobinamide-phosphate guanylyltransferase